MCGKRNLARNLKLKLFMVIQELPQKVFCGNIAALLEGINTSEEGQAL